MLTLKRSILNLCKLSHRNSFWRSQAKASKDLYRTDKINLEILGVHKDADAKQLKKAYYKLAHQYHPDKNSSSESKEKFADIKKQLSINLVLTKCYLTRKNGKCTIKLAVKGIATQLDMKLIKAKEVNKNRRQTLIQKTSSVSLKDLEISKRVMPGDLKTF